MLNAVQKKNIATRASIVDVGNFILVKSGPTSNDSDVDLLNSDPKSVSVEEVDFRS